MEAEGRCFSVTACNWLENLEKLELGKFMINIREVCGNTEQFMSCYGKKVII